MMNNRLIVPLVSSMFYSIWLLISALLSFYIMRRQKIVAPALPAMDVKEIIYVKK